ncbi:AP-4 complex subunit epsilon [Acorus calamus]|uniref:AP-4 complex subunit epsilon n=1 Tax=Acorus calamus TaxID=4465 RepID=A0AAV9E0B0_ACOCL|nr:AP-4 complex subunit epsilon [Acorus calamus]
MEQLKTIGRELAMGSQGGWGQSKEFLDLVKSIGESRSKAEEDRIILREVDLLKRRISEPDVPRRKMKEYVIRLIYAEMLGHDASFGYIHAVKLAHDESLPSKRTGYLAVTLFLDDGHDLIILIVNTMQKDLRSDNYLVVCAALTAVCRLVNEETIPAILPQVVELLGHPKEAVRKKSVMALHRFHQKSPGSVSHLLSNFRKRLCDNDPGVMGATLCPLFDLITADANSYKDLVMSFVNILKQVAEKRLPKAYDYHQMPAPFIQIKLLKTLALLGAGDKQASESMYTVLGDIFRKCESSSNIGNAVLYECICCVSSIYPNPNMLNAAAEVTSRFLKSDSHNLKYMGIDALGRLLKINPDIAEEHQLAVIDCLEDPDDTLKRKTFELLYKMTKSTNVEVIVDRMIDYMINISDNHYKTEIASRCVELAEQFAPSNQWFIQTMNRVFEHAGDLVNVKVAHNLMRLIAEGFGEDDEGADSQLRSSAVSRASSSATPFACSATSTHVTPSSSPPPSASPILHSFAGVNLLRTQSVDPNTVLREVLSVTVICWVLGEYGTADGKYSAAYITGKLCDVAEAHSNDSTVKGQGVGTDNVDSKEVEGWVEEVEINIVGRVPPYTEVCQSLIDELSASHSTDLQQRAYELQALLGLDAHSVENILPSDASCEDIEVDKSLSFLNSFVQQSLEKGARPYIPENERSGIVDTGNFGHSSHQDASSHALRTTSSFSNVPVPETLSTDGEVRLRLQGVQKKWGRPTYSSPTPSSSASTSEKASNGVTAHTKDVSFDSRKQKVEASAEKQRLAASLFGSSSLRSDKKTSSSQRASKGSTVSADKLPAVIETVATEPPLIKKPLPPQPPPPDLLDLGEPTTGISQSLDPFKELEGLLGPTTQELSPAPVDSVGATKQPDLMALYTDTPLADLHGMTSGLPNITSGNSHGGAVVKKGPNPQDSLEKDALSRQAFFRFFPGLEIHGWEIDPCVVSIGWDFFRLSSLEERNKGVFGVACGPVLLKSL